MNHLTDRYKTYLASWIPLAFDVCLWTIITQLLLYVNYFTIYSIYVSCFNPISDNLGHVPIAIDEILLHAKSCSQAFVLYNYKIILYVYLYHIYWCFSLSGIVLTKSTCGFLSIHLVIHDIDILSQQNANTRRRYMYQGTSRVNSISTPPLPHLPLEDTAVIRS